LSFATGYDEYILTLDLAGLSPLPELEGETKLKIPGQTEFSGWRVGAAIIEPEEITEKDDFTAYFDLAKTGDRLTVRGRRRGDRFQPLGLPQPKKLGEFMIDSRIPQAWRQYIPIVCSPEQIVWLVGWRIDERVKVSQKTKQVLCLKFEQE
jgi:tRNA(Ile)-lysidine synthase